MFRCKDIINGLKLCLSILVNLGTEMCLFSQVFYINKSTGRCSVYVSKSFSFELMVPICLAVCTMYIYVIVCIWHLHTESSSKIFWYISIFTEQETRSDYWRGERLFAHEKTSHFDAINECFKKLINLRTVWR